VKAGDERVAVVARLTGPDGPFPLTTMAIEGVDVRVYANAPDSIRDVLVLGRQWGERPALTYEDERYTWAEYLDLVGRFAAALVDRFGVRPGDRVAIAARNYPEWVAAFGASLSVGAVCVPLNAWWTGPELANALFDCGAVVVVADAERSALVQAERGRLPELRHVVEVRPGAEPSGDHLWSAVLDSHRAAFDLASVPIAPDDLATIMYTSGTTGTPKGAVATHRAHLTTLTNMQLHARVEAQLAALRGEVPRVPPALPTTLVVGPLFHIAPLPRVIAAPLTGTHLVLMRKWDAARAIELIEREQVDTVPGGVPTVIASLLDEVERTDARLPSLRSLTSGGAAAPSALIARIGTVFDHPVEAGAGYGLTETTGPMVMIGSHDQFERPLSVGRPFPTSDLRVVGADGRDVVPGQVGEAWLRGANAALRYWNPQHQAFCAGRWFRSGDLVRVDEDGFLYIVDRLKDVVIRSGENVYCQEVEEVLSTHPDVEDCAVLGRAHPVHGEEVVAVVRTRGNATSTAEELRRHVGERLAPFKVPAVVYVQTGDFPRNAAGKILKGELRNGLSRHEVVSRTGTSLAQAR
jgi:acyl-CoA synthetase (AMP-forming)/AMP-acid ligase II